VWRLRSPSGRRHRPEPPFAPTDDGAAIPFELRGRTFFGEDGEGRQNLVGWFEAADTRYAWLNDVVCIAEGVIEDEGMRIAVYTGMHELDA
jgi:Protein of unknown function (DUF3237)